MTIIDKIKVIISQPSKQREIERLWGELNLMTAERDFYKREYNVLEEAFTALEQARRTLSRDRKPHKKKKKQENRTNLTALY